MPAGVPARVRFRAQPKPGGVRWLARLDPTTAAAYVAAVAPLVPAIERGLAASVVANRVCEVGTDPPAIGLEDWRVARGRFRRLVRRAGADAGAALVADVRDCYGSIAPSAVALGLERLGARREDVRPTLRILERFGALGVRGLPIGPEPSAVLANAVLGIADRALAEAGLAHVRWVDDVVVLAADGAEAGRALRVLEHALATIGLGLAGEKTRVILDPAAIRGGDPGRLSHAGRRPRTAATG